MDRSSGPQDASVKLDAELALGRVFPEHLGHIALAMPITSSPVVKLHCGCGIELRKSAVELLKLPLEDRLNELRPLERYEVRAPAGIGTGDLAVAPV